MKISVNISITNSNLRELTKYLLSILKQPPQKIGVSELHLYNLNLAKNRLLLAVARSQGKPTNKSINISLEPNQSHSLCYILEGLKPETTPLLFTIANHIRGRHYREMERIQFLHEINNI